MIIYKILYIFLTSLSLALIIVLRLLIQSKMNVKILQEMLNSVPEKVCMYNKNGNIIAWNQAFIENYPNYTKLLNSKKSYIKRFCGFFKFKNVFLFPKIVDKDIWINENIKCLLKKNQQFEKNINNKWFRIVDYKTRCGNFVLFCSDITELKRAEQMAKSKQTLLSTMAHDIRNPLGAMLLAVEGIIISGDMNKQQKDFAAICKRGGDELLQLVDDILEFSQLESNKILIKNKKFNLFDIINDVVKLFELKANEKKIKLKFVYPKEIYRHYMGDERAIRQIVSNLISNGIKFTDEGSVSVQVLEGKNIYEQTNIFEIKKSNHDIRLAHDTPTPGYAEIVIRVQDTGIGMDETGKQKLFDEFERIHAEPKNEGGEKYNGTGLGLSIVKQLVDLMGGKIEVRSIKDLGSIFDINLKLKISNDVNGLENEGRRGIFNNQEKNNAI